MITVNNIDPNFFIFFNSQQKEPVKTAKEKKSLMAIYRLNYCLFKKLILKKC